MKKDTADLLEDLAGRHFEDISIRDDYSGTCMFGETTYAVVSPNGKSDLLAMLTDAMVQALEPGLGYDDDDEIERVKEALADLRECREDSMGRSAVTY